MRVWGIILVFILVSCGSLQTTTPTPLAGDLLSAPTTLNMGGRLVKIEASPSVDGEQFSVKVRMQATRLPMPKFSVTNVYVVTNGGVWESKVTQTKLNNCSTNTPLCSQGVATGSSSGFQSGELVQVILKLQDPQMRVLWLRDNQAKIINHLP